MAAKRIVQQPVAQLPIGYAELLETLKARIRQAQVRAALSVNRELVLLYWHIGKEVLQRQEREGWGTKVIDRLALDLAREFPEMKGFSPRNLKYMRAFAEAWPDEQIVQEALAQNNLLRHPDDRPSIGLILCKSQNRLVAEYALRDMNKPMGVATYSLTEALPADLQEHLPSIEELQKELGYGG